MVYIYVCDVSHLKFPVTRTILPIYRDVRPFQKSSACKKKGKQKTSLRMKIEYIFPSVVSLLLLLSHSAAAVPVGICYGRLSDNQPPLSAAASLIKTNLIPAVRLFNPDAATLSVVSSTGAALMIGIPNEALPSLAGGDTAFSLHYLQSTIFSLINPSQLRYLSVGNEIFFRDTFYATSLVPAIKNIYSALRSLNLSERVKISSPLATSILLSSYPPSSGAFDATFQSEMISLLEFLRDSNSALMVNVYPFFSYIKNPRYISLDYALFRPAPIERDQNLNYDNLFDATIDAFIHAMEREGFAGIPVVVAETGWPTGGGAAASVENAAAYNRNVAIRSIRNVGTPKRPGVRVEVFLFDLIDEDKKEGEEYEKHFGVFRVDGKKAYDIDFS